LDEGTAAISIAAFFILKNNCLKIWKYKKYFIPL
jgi:hypothetical protein